MTTETLHWFTSSYSEHGGACVEVTCEVAASHGIVPVRDSKTHSGPVVAFPTTAWSAFVTSLKH
ncbi:DUF397 domain-containing protein [Streptomyces xiamenensis]